MRLPDDNKRRQIVATAASMFVSQPYHKVRLDDVAAAAGVGKGTLYVYFQSKEQLYFSIISDGIAMLLERLNEQLAVDHAGALHRLKTIVGEVVHFAHAHPQLFEMMKTGNVPADNPHWNEQRENLFKLIEQTIRAGVETGELRDENPALTARFIPGLVRSAKLFGPKDLDPEALKDHICRLLESGLACGAVAPSL